MEFHYKCIDVRVLTQIAISYLYRCPQEIYMSLLTLKKFGDFLWIYRVFFFHEQRYAIWKLASF